MTKRLFDILFSVVVLLLFSWLLLLAWLVAVLDTKTNGIFIQYRVGHYGKLFRIYKLRTMQVAPETKKLQISRLGRLLRKYKLDELPQLINVLKGEMSIVGPRPDIEGYYDLLEGVNRKVLELKPGLTSLASLKYYNEESLLEKQSNPLKYNDEVLFPDKVRLNLDYYYHKSFWGDLKIIFDTCRFFWGKRKGF
ncbi:sugar transferase [Flavobacterium sp.]|uniref:sugar transferase n=1 Tax=Flavobacterium sp. TaxID=239 RepID=UPI002D7EA57D|nr:sugar transferase [Flavobacterium sp.]